MNVLQSLNQTTFTQVVWVKEKKDPSWCKRSEGTSSSVTLYLPSLRTVKIQTGYKILRRVGLGKEKEEGEHVMSTRGPGRSVDTLYRLNVLIFFNRMIRPSSRRVISLCMKDLNCTQSYLKKKNLVTLTLKTDNTGGYNETNSVYHYRLGPERLYFHVQLIDLVG